MIGRVLIGICLLGFIPLAARADANADWRKIEAMEKTGPGTQWKTREEAQAGALDFLARQERELRDFIAEYPADARVPEAKLRLAHLLATRSDLDQNPRERREAAAVLDELESEPAMKGRRADIEFARISIFMQRVNVETGENRDALLEKARAFAKEFPDDRRIAPLLTEVASAFQDEPRIAWELLKQAQPGATTPELKARIADDLKRLEMLGRPLKMHWTAVDGTDVDLDEFQGRVVLIYFFASWSRPSMAELDWVDQLARHFDGVVPLGICLDHDPTGVPAMMADHGIAWRVYCDGMGWQGKLVRSLGINALPTLWIVDKNGILIALNAKQDAQQLIENAVSDSTR